MEAGGKMNALPTTEAISVTNQGLAFPVRATAVAALLIGLASLITVGCTQRAPGCAPRADDFAVKITPVAGSKTGMGDCDTRFDDTESVQTMGMQPFFNAPGASRINKVAVQPFETGNYAVNAPSAAPPAMDDLPTHHPYAYGSFTTESPDNQNLCHVNQWSQAAEVQFDKGFTLPPPGGDMDGGTDDGGAMEGGASDADAGVADEGSSEAGASKDAGASTDTGASTESDAGGDDGGDNGGMCPPPAPEPQLDFPPLHVKYEFSNMRLYVTPALTGSIFDADLTYTSVTGGVTCSFKYKLRGVSPSVSCADENGKPSDAICHAQRLQPCATSGTPLDNGIPQPDWKSEPVPTYKNKNAIYTICDPATLTCVLDPKDPHLP